MRPLPEFDRDLAARMYADGATIQEIADAQPEWGRDHMRLRLIAEGIHQAGRIRPGVMGNRQSNTVEKYAEAFEAGLDDERIARDFRVSQRRVSDMRRNLGFRPHRPSAIHEPLVNDEEVVRLTDAGFTASQIARRLGTTRRTVERSRKRSGLVLADYPLASLPPLSERLMEAEAMLADGAPFTEVSRTLHLHRRTLRRHFPGRQWTPEQCIEHARATKFMKKRIRQAWPNA